MSFERGLALAFALLVVRCGGFERGDPEDTDSDAPGDSAPVGGTVTFASDIAPILTRQCGSCHGSGGVAAASAFRLSGVAADDYAGVVALIAPGDAAGSTLLQRASGQSHGGGVVFATTAPDYVTIAAWITDGAPQ